MRILRPVLACLVFIFLAVPFSYAQNWNELNPPLNIFNGIIYANGIDSSGNVYAAGDLTNSSNKHFVAKWDGVSWNELGTGTASLNAAGDILSLITTPGGTVYAAGDFANDSGHYVAKWNGITWNELGKGDSSLKANGSIYSLVKDRSGNIYASGTFTNSSGKYYVAKWNGSTWSELGTGVNALNANNAIFAITADSSGNIYAGGYFTNAAGKEYVAKWNGSTWSETGAGANGLNANDYIGCLATDANGNVYAGGTFRNSLNKYYLAKWDGNAWSELGNSLNANDGVKTVVIKNNNEIYAAGFFTNIIGVHYVAKWDGSTWKDVDTNYTMEIGNKDINCLQVDAAKNIYAGGGFTNKAGHNFIAKWNGTSWTEPGSKGDPFYTFAPIYKVVADSSGDLYVSGYFKDGGGNSYLEHWNGSGWNTIMPSEASHLYLGGRITIDRLGNIYSVGNFNDGNTSYACVIKYDGQQWSVLENYPNELNSPTLITDIQTNQYGNVFISGSFQTTQLLAGLAEWDGSKWIQLPSSADYISNFCVSGDGIIYAFGGFYGPGGYYVGRYDLNGPGGWAEVKNPDSTGLRTPGSNEFISLATDSKHNLYVNGLFNTVNGKRYVAKWDEKNWSQFGLTDNLGATILTDKEDNVYSTSPVASTGDCNVKKWNGTSWIGLGSPLTPLDVQPYGEILATDVNGYIYSNALSNTPGLGYFIVQYKTAPVVSPKITSFSPRSGSNGTPVKITGQHFTGVRSVSFGGTSAASYTINNDSTVIATVADGATGNVFIQNSAGADSMQLFTYTCDSVNMPVPVISSIGDSILMSTHANYYQWYLNNNKIQNAIFDSLPVGKAGFYHVETSTNKLCWVSSLDLPVINALAPLNDTLKMNIYPVPSSGRFTVDVKLQQTTSVKAYVAIYDVNGIQVSQTNKLIFFGSEVKIPVTINTKGTYFVKVFVNGDSRQQVIMII